MKMLHFRIVFILKCPCKLKALLEWGFFTKKVDSAIRSLLLRN